MKQTENRKEKSMTELHAAELPAQNFSPPRPRAYGSTPQAASLPRAAVLADSGRRTNQNTAVPPGPAGVTSIGGPRA